LRRMRRKHLICILLILAIATLAATTMPAYSSDREDVQIYIWNPGTASNVYPALAYPAPTYVEVWIDTPNAWDNTPGGIVGYTVSVSVDPSVVEVLTALIWPDTDFDGVSNGFLGDFLSRWGHNWLGYSTSFLGGSIDKPSGTISGTAEAILGFSTLGLGAGGGPMPLFRYVIRTASGVDPATAYSPIALFDAFYTTVDGVKHPVDIVEDGHYGAEPAPEFPLGLGLMIAMAPAIPVVYLWRTRKRRY